MNKIHKNLFLNFINKIFTFFKNLFPQTKYGKREFKILLLEIYLPGLIPITLGSLGFLSGERTLFLKFLYIILFILYILINFLIIRNKVIKKEKINDMPFSIHVIQTEDNAKLKQSQAKFSNDILAYLEETRHQLFLFENISQSYPGLEFCTFNRTEIKNDKSFWREYFEDLSEEWKYFISLISIAASLHAVTHNRKFIIHVFQNCPVLLSFYFGYLIGNIDNDLYLYNYGTKPNSLEKYHPVVDCVNTDLSEFRKVENDLNSDEIKNFIIKSGKGSIKTNNFTILKNLIDISKPIDLLIHFHYKEGKVLEPLENQIIIHKMVKIDEKIEPHIIGELYKILSHISSSVKNELNIYFNTSNSIATSIGFAFAGLTQPRNLYFCQKILEGDGSIKFSLKELYEISKII